MGQQSHMCEGISQEVDVIGDEAQQKDAQHPVNNCESVLTATPLVAGAVSWLAKHTQHSAVAVEK